jgi:hypothetical protein
VDDVAVYLATEQLMADNEQRGGLVKQAQWVSTHREMRTCAARKGLESAGTGWIALREG